MSWLGDLIDEAVNEAAGLVDSTIHAVDGAVHDAAVGLLNTVLPPMIHTQYTLVKGGNWVPIESATISMRLTLGTANVSGALAGNVEKKVSEGLDHLTCDTDYARAVNSIQS